MLRILSWFCHARNLLGILVFTALELICYLGLYYLLSRLDISDSGRDFIARIILLLLIGLLIGYLAWPRKPLAK